MPSDSKKKEAPLDPNVKLGPDGKPVPLTETEQVQLQIENAASEVSTPLKLKLILLNSNFCFQSLESTRRMVQMLDESKEAGIKTLVMLDEQGEQLDRIEEGADRINQEMKEAEKNLEGLEQCCGLCVLPWKKTKNFEKGEEYNKTWKNNEDGKLNQNGPRRIIGDTGPAGKGFVNRITNDSREDEMVENLFIVCSMIVNL